MSGLYPEITRVIDELAEAVEAIDPARKELLQSLARYVGARRAAGQTARLIFICTHNSRRSQIAQLWAQAAAAHYGIDGVETFSGGTEATAFAPPAVASMHRHGFRVEKEEGRENPRYVVRFAPDAPAVTCWSKVYDEAPNPTEGFAAVMVCSSADEGCPFVAGSDLRVALPFVDPKEGDGTAQEAAVYDLRLRQVAAEMVYSFSAVKV